MYKIVYVLGAGFSAPLGIPVMNNFFSKSRNLYKTNQQQLQHFKDIFEYWDKCSVANNYFNINIHNIEEFLSVLEMDNNLKGQGLEEKYKRYLADVVENYFPKSIIKQGISIGSDLNTIRESFEEIKYHYYTAFVGNLCQYDLRDMGIYAPGAFEYKTYETEIEYIVISLNYDTVLERFFKVLKTIFPHGKQEPAILKILKLHGTASDFNTIIPPTWNKLMHSEKINVWREAFEEISQASEIRILGYSLPESDNYFRYFLLSSIKDNYNLENIDIICLDDEERVVQGRYEKFFSNKFQGVSFNNMDIVRYLEKVSFRTYNLADKYPHQIYFDGIEIAHNDSFGRPILKNEHLLNKMRKRN